MCRAISSVQFVYSVGPEYTGTNHILDAFLIMCFIAVSYALAQTPYVYFVLFVTDIHVWLLMYTQFESQQSYFYVENDTLDKCNFENSLSR